MFSVWDLTFICSELFLIIKHAAFVTEQRRLPGRLTSGSTTQETNDSEQIFMCLIQYFAHKNTFTALLISYNGVSQNNLYDPVLMNIMTLLIVQVLKKSMQLTPMSDDDFFVSQSQHN